MDAKDWVLLLVPILANGVLIFVFQKVVQQRINKANRIAERKKVIVENFLELLADATGVVSEASRRFRFREDMEGVNEDFRVSISILCEYGKNNDKVLDLCKDLEKIRAKCGYCHNRLVRYQRAGWEVFPIDEQNQISDDLCEIQTKLSKLLSKAIKK